MEFMYPVEDIAITQGYHKGKSLDFGYYNKPNRAILSCGDGIVYKRETQATGGKTIFIKHTNGYISCYGHLNDFNVKVGDSVKRGKVIGHMGKTGKCSAQHLHFGIYSSDKKNIYGNADIDPFKVCEVYPSQKVCQSGTTKKYLSKFKYYEKKEDWTTGGYELLYDKAIRSSHKLANNTYKVKECDDFTKKYLTSKKPNDTAYVKKGTGCTIREIIKESNGRIWGYWYKYWIVLCNIDGTKQVKKVK